MQDLELAQEVVARFNNLIKDEAVCHLVEALIRTRVNVTEAILNHPTIQCVVLNDGIDDHYQVGLLGILNGLVGALPKDSVSPGQGYIVARFEPQGQRLLSFGVLGNEGIDKTPSV